MDSYPDLISTTFANVPADPWGGFCFSVVKGVRVVKGVKVICFVDSYPDLTSTTFTNVPADLHELLSTAKNRPELNIRIYDPITSYFL